MKANPMKVISLFEPTHRYVVPIFQRHYVWSKTEQWEPLWGDIEEKLAEKSLGRRVAPHFLGAVILDSTRRTSSKEVSRFLVIDGQQRLTTLQILITAIRDVAEFQGQKSIGKIAERCLLNPDTELMERPDQEVFKLWPTQVNRDVFCGIVTARSLLEVQKKFPLVYRKTKSGRTKRNPEPRERLVDAYEFFYARVNALCEKCKSSDEKSDALMSLISVLRDDFTVVEIVLDEGDDSQEIFNSLNGRGKPLSQSDLLRSYIFMRVEKAEIQRDEFYRKYWERFENHWWDFEVKRGNQTSSRLDLLTRSILSSQLGQAVDVKRVHSAYRDWIDRAKPYPSLEEELKLFGLYGDAFEQLHGKTKGILSDFGKRMTIWETSTVFPLACFLASECSLTETVLHECLELIESFVVRRAICALNNKEYNKFFIDVISKVRGTQDIQISLSEVLMNGEGDTRRFPNDDEFKHSWVSNQFYGRFSSEQLVQIFLRIEASVRSSRAEHTTISLASIEHVMPQDWAENYPLSGEYIPKNMTFDWYFPKNEEEKSYYENVKAGISRRRRMIHNVGNLTAVTQPLNSAMKNAKFEVKKNNFQESVLSINRYFERFDSWSEEQIEKRAEVLFTHANSIWKSPR